MQEPKIFKKEAFHVAGIINHYPNALVNFDSSWRKYMTVAETLEPLSTGEGNYGVYLGGDYTKPLHYLAGISVKDLTSIPLGIEVKRIPTATYIVFESPYEKLIETYTYIHQEWFPISDYKIDFTKFGFDFYPQGQNEENLIQIWIPVLTK